MFKTREIRIQGGLNSLSSLLNIWFMISNMLGNESKYHISFYFHVQFCKKKSSNEPQKLSKSPNKIYCEIMLTSLQ